MTTISLADFKDDELSLWYRGIFDDSITDNLIQASEASSVSGLGKSRKRVYFLMAESYQNIVRHGIQKDGKEVSGTFGVINREGQFHIFSSNQVSEEAAMNVEGQLKELNQLDKVELKKKYLETLNHGTMSQQGGAGLGLIEMARKSEYPLQSKFMKHNDSPELCIQIDKAISNEAASNIAIEESIAISKKMSDEGVLLLFKGDFNSDTANNMVSMLSQNLSDFQVDQKQKRVFHVGVEMIQNISRHGFKRDGITEGLFVMATKGDKMIISSVNYIAADQIDELKNHLDKINNSDSEELRRWYKEKLRDSVKNDNSMAGIGLIDIGKWLDEDIEYDFTEHKDYFECEIEVKLSLK